MTKKEAESLRENFSGIFSKLNLIHIQGKLEQEDFRDIDEKLKGIYKCLEGIATDDEKRSVMTRKKLDDYETDIKKLQEKNDEINSLQEKCNDYEISIKKLQEETNEINSLQKKLRDYEIDIKKLQEKNNELNSLHKKLNEYELYIKKLQGDIKNRNNEFNSFNEKVRLTIQDQQKEIERLKSENIKLQKEIPSLKQPQSGLKPTINEMILSPLQKKANDYETDIKKLQIEIQNKNNELNSVREKARGVINKYREEIEQLKSDNITLQEVITFLKQPQNGLKSAINSDPIHVSNLISENSKPQEIITSLKQPQNGSKIAINSDLINIFNQWALNPLRSLPQGFSYVSGDLRRRTKQTFDLVLMETKWIVDSDKKVLFPNPNFFDDQTDISELYLMDTGRLKPKGKNRIKIIEPCEIVEDGFIRFQGKLELL